MKSSLVTLFAALITLFAKGQSDQSKQVYFELGGAGGGASINYDARFGQKENGLGYRAGIGGEYSYSSFLGSRKALTIPVGINYLLGKRKHYFEMGSGATAFFGDETYYPKSYWGFNLGAGYRLTPFEKRGVSFRAGYMQWLMFYGSRVDLDPHFYLSVGYRF